MHFSREAPPKEIVGTWEDIDTRFEVLPSGRINYERRQRHGNVIKRKRIIGVGMSGWESGEATGNVMCFKARVKVGSVKKRPDTLAMLVDDRILFKKLSEDDEMDHAKI